MFGKMTGLTGLICLTAVIIVGCRGGSSSAVPGFEQAGEAPKTQPIVAVETTVIPTITASAQNSAPTIASTSPAETTPVTAVGRPPTPNLELPQPFNQLDERAYDWNQVLGRDAILPIYEPEFVSAQNAPYADDELVIGVELNGEARAYAIGPLNSREMVNDTVGGVPILVTW